MPKRKDVSSPWPMTELHDAIAALHARDDFSAMKPLKRERLILKITEKSAGLFEKALYVNAPRMLAQRRADLRKFEQRNFRRWRPAFDLIETIWASCEELGGHFDQLVRPEAIRAQDFIFEAISALHARALLVTAEMICLMKSGFADAALSRWRTLYELNVVASLITREGSQLALRYLAHAEVQAAKELTESDPDDDEKLVMIRQRAERAIAQFGDEMKRNYGWACEVAQKKRPNFEDLERLANKDEGRALYKFASHHIHSNHRAFDEMLGLSESRQALLLVGPSNSGMAGPLTLGAMTMVDMTRLYLSTYSNFDRIAFALVLAKMAQRLNRLAASIERRTLDSARKREALRHE